MFKNILKKKHTGAVPTNARNVVAVVVRAVLYCERGKAVSSRYLYRPKNLKLKLVLATNFARCGF